MSKADILSELPRLKSGERREIFDRLCEIEESDLLQGAAPSAEERALLDQELEDYRRNPNAGSPWLEVEARLRKPAQQ
jgi:hypothetical protein